MTYKWTSADTFVFIDDFFRFYTSMKTYHWLTKVYARHVASDRLLDRVLELTDRFIEVYIGHFGRPDAMNKQRERKEVDVVMSDKNVVEYMRSFAEKINGWKHLPADLANIRDDLAEAVHQAMYLFTLT